MKRTWSQLIVDVLQQADYHVACQTEAAIHYGEVLSRLDLFCCWWQGAATGFFNDQRSLPLWWRLSGRDFPESDTEPSCFFNEDDMTTQDVPKGWESVGTDHEDSYPVPQGWAVAETHHDHSDDPIYQRVTPSA